MGSLLPDSNSKSGLSFPFTPTFWVLRMENTAAASVEEMIAPSRKASLKEKRGRQASGRAMKSAVRNTPSVESTSPWRTMGRTSSHRVSNPPENRMKARAKVPMEFVVTASSNCSPPGPFSPASIPMARNRMSPGTLMRSESVPATRLRKKRSPATRKGSTYSSNQNTPFVPTASDVPAGTGPPFAAPWPSASFRLPMR